MAYRTDTMMQALILGESGVLGTTIKHRLELRGVMCVGTSRSPASAGSVRLDLREPDGLRAILGRSAFNVVINAAAAGVTRHSSSQRDRTLVNDIGAGLVAETISQLAPSTALIHIASATEPQAGEIAESDYARTKASGCERVRRIAQREGICVTFVRVHNAYALQRTPGRFISDTVDAAIGRREISLEFPDRVRDFCLLDDVAECIAELATNTSASIREAEIGTGYGLSIRHTAQCVYETVGSPISLVRSRGSGRPDPHPISVANPLQAGFMRCKTLLPEGLDIMIGMRA